MMKRSGVVPVVLLMVTVIALQGCTIAKISGRGALPILLNNPPSKVEVVKHVENSKRIAFDYTGAIDASEVLTDFFATTNADAMINVTLTLKTDFSDFLFNMFTLGLANSKHFVVTGDLIKAPEGLGSIEIPGFEILAESKDFKELMDGAIDGAIDTSRANMLARTKSGFALIHYDVD